MNMELYTVRLEMQVAHQWAQQQGNIDRALLHIELGQKYLEEVIAGEITEAERADRLEAMIDRMSETISECVLLIRPMYDLCQQIEICGASVELTKAVSMAADIMHKLMAATGTKQLPLESKDK
jgi:hypothetical protein